MSNYMKTALMFFSLLVSPLASAQPSSSCTTHEKFIDSVSRCVDVSTDDVIVLGTLRVDVAKDGKEKIILHDETRGDIQLILTATLIDAVNESPADSYEVEGYLANGEMTVKNLRPIE